MKIAGFQKVTLLDFPGLVACTVFIGGCNFRCPFCHNADVVEEKTGGEFSKEEIISYLKKRKGVLDGVCVTGGEPLLYPETLDFMREIKDLGFKIKLDTNGSVPSRLKEAVFSGLCDYAAMDIKNTLEKYSITAGGSVNTEKIKESVSFLLSDVVPYEFRTTVVKELHTKDDILKISEEISGASKWYLQQFVDSGNLIGSGFSAYSPSELEDFAAAARKNIPETHVRGI